VAGVDAVMSSVTGVDLGVSQLQIALGGGNLSDLYYAGTGPQVPVNWQSMGQIVPPPPPVAPTIPSNMEWIASSRWETIPFDNAIVFSRLPATPPIIENASTPGTGFESAAIGSINELLEVCNNSSECKYVYIYKTYPAQGVGVFTGFFFKNLTKDYAYELALARGSGTGRWARAVVSLYSLDGGLFKKIT
jgi:hypothetical protein